MVTGISLDRGGVTAGVGVLEDVPATSLSRMAPVFTPLELIAECRTTLDKYNVTPQISTTR
jgi:hypothetical protein